MLLKNYNKKLALADQKSFIPDSSFIKIGSLLFLIKLFKYTSTISTGFIKNLKSTNITKKILSNLWHIMRINVLLKLILSI